MFIIIKIYSLNKFYFILTSLQLSTLLASLTKSGQDHYVYCMLLGSLGFTISHMTQDDIITQLHLVWYLLEYVTKQLSTLTEVCV